MEKIMLKLLEHTIWTVAVVLLISGCDWLPSDPDENTLDEGLVAHYSFDKGQATDDSGNGNNCRLLGDPSAVDGVNGQALRLDGTGDHANCGSDDSFDMKEAITISAWLRPLTLDNTGSSDWIAGKWKVDGTKGAWLLGIKTRKRPNFGMSSDEKGYNEVIAEMRVELNSFSHIVGVYDGRSNQARIYVNGRLASATRQAEDISASRSDVLLGATRYALSSERFENYLHGDLDEVRFYSRALKGSEIRTLYQRGTEAME